jgi:hypothetical protein
MFEKSEEALQQLIDDIVKRTIKKLFGEEWSMKARVLHHPGFVVGTVPDHVKPEKKFVVIFLAHENEDEDLNDEKIVKIRIEDSGTVEVLAQGKVPAGESKKLWNKTRSACLTLAILEKFLKETE